MTYQRLSDFGLDPYERRLCRQAGLMRVQHNSPGHLAQERDGLAALLQGFSKAVVHNRLTGQNPIRTFAAPLSDFI